MGGNTEAESIRTLNDINFFLGEILERQNESEEFLKNRKLAFIW